MRCEECSRQYPFSEQQLAQFKKRFGHREDQGGQGEGTHCRLAVITGCLHGFHGQVRSVSGSPAIICDGIALRRRDGERTNSADEAMQKLI